MYGRGARTFRGVRGIGQDNAWREDRADDLSGVCLRDLRWRRAREETLESGVKKRYNISEGIRQV